MLLLIALLSLGIAACTQEQERVIPVPNKKTETIDKEISILKSMNLDTGKSSNEMHYGNFVVNDKELRKLMGKKAVEQGLVEFFEAEGINFYLKDDFAVFYYMPLDDMADTFIEVPISLDVIEGSIN